MQVRSVPTEFQEGATMQLGDCCLKPAVDSLYSFPALFHTDRTIRFADSSLYRVIFSFRQRHDTNHARRNPCNDDVCFHRASNNGACSNNRIVADGDSGQDYGAGTDPYIVSDEDVLENCLAIIMLTINRMISRCDDYIVSNLAPFAYHNLSTAAKMATLTKVRVASYGDCLGHDDGDTWVEKHVLTAKRQAALIILTNTCSHKPCEYDSHCSDHEFYDAHENPSIHIVLTLVMQI